MDKQQWDLEFDKAMDDKFVTQQLIMEITDQIEELEKRKAGLDEVDLSMIEIELPDVPEVEIPSFEPQKEKAEKAMLEKSVTEELNNTVYHNSDGIHDMEKKESLLIS